MDPLGALCIFGSLKSNPETYPVSGCQSLIVQTTRLPSVSSISLPG